MHDRSVFYISRGTGITAESVGHLLIHFPRTHFRQIRMPYIDSEEKLDGAVQRIAEVWQEDGIRPVVIHTLINPAWRSRLHASGALCLDVFGALVEPLADELKQRPVDDQGGSRGVTNETYFERMEAINFTLGHDDGMTEAGLEEAQVILVGVSRCGKTPTSLYLAMQFGIKAANYPLIPEDFARGSLPAVLLIHTDKVFGLTIRPDRLHAVRHERRPGSHYASLENCRDEIGKAENLMRQAGIQWLDSSTRSIEELSTTILQHIRTAPTESFL